MSRTKRSLLYMPADNPRMVEKAATVGSDAVIFDLEDAVGTEHKAQAREVLRNSPIWTSQREKELLIRLNDVSTPYFYEDLRLAAALRPDAVVLPKATEDAVAIVDTLLAPLEAEFGVAAGSIRLIPLIESAYGVCRAYEIARKSGRITAMQFGAEDFTRDLEVTRTKGGREFWLARMQMAMACKANGIEAIDTPFTDYRDDAGLAEDCEAAKQAGMSGKTCIHPRQVETVNRAFSPSPAEIEQAARILACAGRPENLGRGAFPLDGKMIDAPVIARARRTMEKAELNRA